MAKETKHRMRVSLEIEFDYFDGPDYNEQNVFLKKAELVEQVRRELKVEGVQDFVRNCDFGFKGTVKSVTVAKYRPHPDRKKK